MDLHLELQNGPLKPSLKLEKGLRKGIDLRRLRQNGEGGGLLEKGFDVQNEPGILPTKPQFESGFWEKDLLKVLITSFSHPQHILVLFLSRPHHIIITSQTLPCAVSHHI